MANDKGNRAGKTNAMAMGSLEAPTLYMIYTTYPVYPIFTQWKTRQETDAEAKRSRIEGGVLAYI